MSRFAEGDEPAEATEPAEPAAAAVAEAEARRPARRPWTALRLAWTVLLAVVLIAAGWAGWLLVGSNLLAANRAEAAGNRLQAACSAGTESPAPGQAIGWLSLGTSTEEWPIIVGTDDDALSSGVGWYPRTAGPGEIGNMVLVGYRITNGAPFADLLELNVGDQVVVRSCTEVFTYVIDLAPRDLTVQAGDDWVLDAVPGEPGQVPTGRMITLITSQDLLPTTDRSVGFGHLVQAQPR